MVVKKTFKKCFEDMQIWHNMHFNSSLKQCALLGRKIFTCEAQELSGGITI